MLYAFYFVYVIRMRLICDLMSRVCHPYIIRMWLVCTHMSFVCYPYVLVCHSYDSCMCSHLIRMSLVWTHVASACTWMPFLCHLYVLVFHLYVTSICSFVIPVSLLCTRMLSVRHSYVLVSHLYVARMWLYCELNRTCFSIDYVDIHIEWNILWKTIHFSKQRKTFFCFIYLVIL